MKVRRRIELFRIISGIIAICAIALKAFISSITVLPMIIFVIYVFFMYGKWKNILFGISTATLAISLLHFSLTIYYSGYGYMRAMPYTIISIIYIFITIKIFFHCLDINIKLISFTAITIAAANLVWVPWTTILCVLWGTGLLLALAPFTLFIYYCPLYRKKNRK